MKKEYIRDDGKIRNCNSNIAKMNIFEYMWMDVFRNGFFSTMFKYYILENGIEAAKYLGAFLLNLIMFILFPVALTIRAYSNIKSAKKSVEKHEAIWGKKNI